MILVSKSFTFEAAHRLPMHGDELHGHSYRATVSVEVVGTDGMAPSFAAFGDFLEVVRHRLDHKYLNDLMPLPTLEALVVFIAGKLLSHPVRRIIIERPLSGESAEWTP